MPKELRTVSLVKQASHGFALLNGMTTAGAAGGHALGFLLISHPKKAGWVTSLSQARGRCRKWLKVYG
jgi:hypothetical protein